MYSIERQPYGFRLVLGEFIKKEEMSAWVNDSRKALAQAPKGFGVLVDMRTLKPLTPDSKAVMEDGQKLYKGAGMLRSVVILDSALLTMQFKNIAKETGIYQWERYLSTATHPDWEELALAWLTQGTDPDKKG